MNEALTLQLFHSNQWHDAARFHGAFQIDKGYKSPSILDYDTLYASEYTNERSHKALSIHHPVGYTYTKQEHWPAFMLDLLPSGAGRRALLNLYNLPDQNAKSDWLLLNIGGQSPIGNLRVKEAVPSGINYQHAGFEKKDIIQRGADFLEYARSHSAPLSGSTGAQGDAPKFLLTQDQQGRWHADGGLLDTDAQAHFLVKFPRGSHSNDRLVLKAEAQYMHIAALLGIRANDGLEWIDNTLFIPRFDRYAANGTVERYGVESLCSLAGVADFGQSLSQFTLCHALLNAVDHPQTELIEFLKRDALNLALGNTDNHARNTAIIKYTDGRIMLSPLFDFAPMLIDPEGIIRSCRWKDAETHSIPDWEKILTLLADSTHYNIDWNIVAQALKQFGKDLEQLPDLCKSVSLDESLQTRLTPRIKHISHSLTGW